MRHPANILDQFLMLYPEKCSAIELPALGFTDHSLVNVKFDAQTDVPFHRMIFWYSKAAFRFYIAETLPPQLSSKIELPELSKGILSSTDNFIAKNKS